CAAPVTARDETAGREACACPILLALSGKRFEGSRIASITQRVSRPFWFPRVPRITRETAIRRCRPYVVMIDLAVPGKLEPATRASGGIGRRAGFRCQCPQGRGGSSPPSRTSTDDVPFRIPEGDILLSRPARVRTRPE